MNPAFDGATQSSAQANAQRNLAHRLTQAALIVAITFLVCGAVFGQGQQPADGSAGSTKGEFSGAMQTVYPDWFKTSFMELEEDVAEAAEAGKRLMLLFHQDGCPYCNAFVERNLAQKDIEERLKSEFDVIEINMWGDREVASVDGQNYTEKTFAAALQVQFTPTVLFLTEQGKLSLRINGYYNPDKFRLALDYVTGKMEQSLPFSEFVQQNTQKKSSAELISRSYFTGNAGDWAKNDSNKPMMLFFEQADCRNCETLHNEVLARKTSQELLSQFDIYQIDLWGRTPFLDLNGKTTTGRSLSRDLGISYAPTLILFSADGQEVIRSEAWFKTFHTQSILNYVLSDAWREQPSFQRYISARADELRNQGIDVNIWD